MTTAYDAPHDEIDKRRWSMGGIALGGVVAAMVAMWVWIYVFAPRTNPDRMADLGFAQAAEALCAPAQDLVDELPRVDTETTPTQRATDVAAGTEITVDLVAALKTEAGAVSEADDQRLLDEWFADWDAYIVDREAYVVRLRSADPGVSRADLAFTLSERAEGGIYTRRIEGFANVNDMASCHVPSDL